MAPPFPETNFFEWFSKQGSFRKLPRPFATVRASFFSVSSRSPEPLELGHVFGMFMENALAQFPPSAFFDVRVDESFFLGGIHLSFSDFFPLTTSDGGSPID